MTPATASPEPTGDIGTLSQPGGPLYNIEHSNDGLITFPGGVLVGDANVYMAVMELGRLHLEQVLGNFTTRSCPAVSQQARGL